MVRQTEITVKIDAGEVVLKAPKAKLRNKTMMESRPNGKLDEMLMMVKLLPRCIVSHPFGEDPLEKALDELYSYDYDLLIDGLTKLMRPNTDLLKKSEPESDQDEI